MGQCRQGFYYYPLDEFSFGLHLWTRCAWNKPISTTLSPNASNDCHSSNWYFLINKIFKATKYFLAQFKGKNLYYGWTSLTVRTIKFQFHHQLNYMHFVGKSTPKITPLSDVWMATFICWKTASSDNTETKIYQNYPSPLHFNLLSQIQRQMQF